MSKKSEVGGGCIEHASQKFRAILPQHVVDLMHTEQKKKGILNLVLKLDLYDKTTYK